MLSDEWKKPPVLIATFYAFKTLCRDTFRRYFEYQVGSDGHSLRAQSVRLSLSGCCFGQKDVNVVWSTKSFSLSKVATSLLTFGNSFRSKKSLDSTTTMISLTIQHWNGETYKVEIDATEYIDDLKEKIEELHDVPIDEQRFSYNGNEVDDTETIEENGIVDGSTLVLEPIKVTIVLPDGKNKIRLTLKPDDCVKKIKRAVVKKFSSSRTKLEGIVVLFDGNVLRDGQKISDCNIDHGDVVVCENFMITVAHWKGDLIDIGNGQITGVDTTEQVKNILLRTEETKDVPREQMKFKFGGNVLNDFLSLKDQKIKHKAVLQLEKPIAKKDKQKFKLSVFPTENPADKESTEITVTIKHWNGSTFNVEIDPEQYMEELKEKVQEVQNIPIDQQRLLFDGEPVDETETLAEQNIDDKAMLTLEAMRIVVQIPCGPDKKAKKLRFVVVPEDNVKRIKRMVVKKAGIPADRQRVLFNGNDLKDSQKLADCVSISCFVFVVKLK